MASLPLQGLRVFDMSQGVAGPSCTLMMAAHGAEVIKVEPPEGDWLRRGARQMRGVSPGALAFNVGKRSIALDLKRPAAQAVAQRIAASCDVVVESFRPGVVDRFGLDAASLRARKSELVYCSISGFGHGSALRTRPTIDHIAQAYSGWMSVNANADGVPQRTRNVVLADQITGLYAWQAVAAALLRRFRFGGGASVEVTLVGAMAAFLAPRIVSHVLSDGSVGNAEFTVPTGDYPTREGLLVLAVQKPQDVQRLCEAIDRADLLQDERFATPAARTRHAEAMRAAVGRVLADKPALEWEAQLSGKGVMACAVRDLQGFLDAQQAHGLSLIEMASLPGLGPCPLVRLPGTQPWGGRADEAQMPRIGEHGRDILQEFGYSPAEIDAHIAEGVLAQPQ